jgi:hypothetical protein
LQKFGDGGEQAFVGGTAQVEYLGNPDQMCQGRSPALPRARISHRFRFPIQLSSPETLRDCEAQWTARWSTQDGLRTHPFFETFRKGVEDLFRSGRDRFIEIACTTGFTRSFVPSNEQKNRKASDSTER